MISYTWRSWRSWRLVLFLRVVVLTRQPIRSNGAAPQAGSKQAVYLDGCAYHLMTQGIDVRARLLFF